MSEKMVKVNLNGVEVSVPSCGKFEVEWALAHLMVRPSITRMELMEALNRQFDTCDEESRMWYDAAWAKLNKMADENGANLMVAKAPELFKISIHRLCMKGTDNWTGWIAGASNLSQRWLDDHNMVADDREITWQEGPEKVLLANIERVN